MIVAQGAGRFGGWSLYVKDGKLTYCYNWLGRERHTIAAAESLPAGPVTVRYDFAYDGGEPGAGGTGTLFVNDVQAGQGHIENTVAYSFSLDEGMEVGCDLASPVTDDYPERNNALPASSTGCGSTSTDSADQLLDPEAASTSPWPRNRKLRGGQTPDGLPCPINRFRAVRTCVKRRYSPARFAWCDRTSKIFAVCSRFNAALRQGERS